MRASDLDYDLPEALIAQMPLPERDGARLMHLRPGAQPSHRRIVDLPGLIPPALIVVNDTRVIPARLFGQRPSGGRVELLLVEREHAGKAAAPTSSHGALAEECWLCMGRANKPLRPGDRIHFDAGFEGEVLGLAERGLRRVRLLSEGSVSEALARVGQLPLPPYIRRAPDASDAERYQTVFAREPGAVAAPTAGLHLSEPLLGRLREAGHELAHVTLHVGPGTFAPLRSEVLADHPMHRERYEISQTTADRIAAARADGRPILAVGTTVVRTLEAAAAQDGQVRAGRASTEIFIYPPYRFRVVDLLLTNFHLPRSTLLALVMAFGGIEPVRSAYVAAVAAGYRFFSYGDAMLLEGSARA